MRFQTTTGLAATLALAAGFFQTSSALVRPKDAEAPRVSADRGPRMHRDVAWDQNHKLAASGLVGWKAVFDADTDVPLRMWGRSAPLAGVVNDPAIAEASARSFLQSHLGVLAPGASSSDFVVLANQLNGAGDLRTVTFEQRAHGVRVLGGAINFAFKNDRLMMVGSTALPHVASAIAMPTHALSPAFVADQATRWLALDGHRVAPQRSGLLAAATERVIVPIIRPRTATGLDVTYQVADQLAVSAIAGVGRWNVWLDAQDGSPIARASTISYASGVVNFDVPDQSPTGTRSPHPAAFATHQVDNASVTATLEGSVTWAGTAAATVVPKLAGSRVSVRNVSGSLVSASLTLQPGGSVTWSQAATPQSDAQLDSYVYANTAKQFVKTRLNPTLGWLDAVVSVSVNENDVCNAFSTGDDVHFFLANAQCENTGRLADVVYHEMGHSVHANSIIPGAGAFDGSLSEGLADTLGVSITGDHGLGRGFMFSDAPLRDVASMPSISDQAGRVKRWPADADGEVHDEGEIIGEALWDTRTALETKLGTAAGFDRTLKIYYGIMQRAVDIPSSFVEALVADDDDGDITNGTPNMCAISGAFAKHGLSDPSLTLGLTAPTRDNFTVSFTADPAASAGCEGAATVTGAFVDWKLRGGSGGKVDLAATGTTWTAGIPVQGDGALVEYRVTVTLSDNTSVTYPNNPADPFYQFYVGEVTKVWCADFESGTDDWTHGGVANEWEVGPPMGLAGDPKTAFGGSNVFGLDLSADGMYQSNGTTSVETPEIDLHGNTTNVHLQYRRWLGVEDGFYDRATISANGTEVWKTFASVNDPMAGGINHLDKEWRFQDIDVSAQAASGKLKLKFDLTSDQGLEFGGWNLDDVCVVVTNAAPTATCGDSAVGVGETCDDGNGIDGDGCSAACQTETGDGSGCCSSSTNPAGAAGLGVLALGLVLRRRRRR